MPRYRRVNCIICAHRTYSEIEIVHTKKNMSTIIPIIEKINQQIINRRRRYNSREGFQW